MVVIEHTVIGDLASIFEHLRFSKSRVSSWEQREDEIIFATLCYQGTMDGWRASKKRAEGFRIKIENESRRSDPNRTYIPVNLPEDAVMQCLKCSHIWRHSTHLRKNGTFKLKCPKCNSNQTLETRYIRTKVTKREDLLMLTNDTYPQQYCPVTDNEEIKGVYIASYGAARIGLGRGFDDAKYGHKIYLYTKNGLQVDSNHHERMSMIGAVAHCPKNATVFVGGLGLGLVLLYLAKSRKTTNVIVAEIDEDVINLIEPRIRAWLSVHYPEFKFTVIRGDALTEVLKNGPYDWVFMDMWKTHKDIEFMKKAEAAGKRNLTARGRVTCWMMDKYKKDERRYAQWKKTRTFKFGVKT